MKNLFFKSGLFVNFISPSNRGIPEGMRNDQLRYGFLPRYMGAHDLPDLDAMQRRGIISIQTRNNINGVINDSNIFTQSQNSAHRMGGTNINLERSEAFNATYGQFLDRDLNFQLFFPAIQADFIELLPQNDNLAVRPLIDRTEIRVVLNRIYFYLMSRAENPALFATIPGFNPADFNITNIFNAVFAARVTRIRHVRGEITRLEAIATRTPAEETQLTNFRNELNTLTLSDSDIARTLLTEVYRRISPGLTPNIRANLVQTEIYSGMQNILNPNNAPNPARAANEDARRILSSHQFRDFVLDLNFSVGDRTFNPFKNITPDELMDWSSINNLILSGRISFESGFYLLAAFERFGARNTILYSNLKGYLMRNIAHQLTIESRLDDSRAVQLLNDAFMANYHKYTSLLNTHVSFVQRNHTQSDTNFLRMLEMQYEQQMIRFQNEEIDKDELNEEVEKLRESARERNLLNRLTFSQNSSLKNVINSRFSQKVKGKAKDVSKFVGKKTFSVVKQPFIMPWKGMYRGVRFAVKSAWGTTKSLFKNAAILAASPVKWVVNFFRDKEWKPFSIKDSLKKDVVNAGKTIKEGALGVPNLLITEPVKDFQDINYKDTDYKAERKKRYDKLARDIENLRPQTERKVLSLNANFNFNVELEAYRNQGKAMGIIT